MNQRLDPHGERFLAYLLRVVPPDTREEVARVFEDGKRVAGSSSYVAVLLAMVRECSVEWSHRAAPR